MLTGIISTVLSLGFLVWSGTEIMSDELKQKHIVFQQQNLINKNSEQEYRVNSAINSLIEDTFDVKEKQEKKKSLLFQEKDSSENFKSLSEKDLIDLATKNNSHYMLLDKEMILIKENTLKFKPEIMEGFKKELLVLFDRNYRVHGGMTRDFYGVIELFGANYAIKGEMAEGYKSWLLAIKKIHPDSELINQINKNNIIITKINLKDKLNMSLVSCFKSIVTFCENGKENNKVYKIHSSIGLMNVVELPNVQSEFSERAMFFVSDTAAMLIRFFVLSSVNSLLV